MRAEPRTVRGTSVDVKDLTRGKVFTTSDNPNLQYAWDTGEAMHRYLAELREGRLIGRRCQECKRVMIPPRMFCERCFRRTDDWVYVKDTGRINTYSLCYVTWDVRRLKRPEIPAVIEIDGASAGMGILHLVRDVPLKKLRVGLRVKAVWKPRSQRTGTITDIDFWTAA